MRDITILAILKGLFSISIIVIVLYYSFRDYRKKKVAEISLKQNVKPISDYISNLTLLHTTTNDCELSRELERNIRRLSLYTNETERIHKALFWFYEHGNSEDKSCILRAIKSDCFKDIRNYQLADETINKIKNKISE